MIPDEEQEEPKVDSLKEVVAFPTYWDGNCFFRAMITHAADIEHAARYTKTGEPWLVKERAKLLQQANALRKQAVEYAVDHGLADLAEEEGWAQSMSENGAWADDMSSCQSNGLRTFDCLDVEMIPKAPSQDLQAGRLSWASP